MIVRTAAQGAKKEDFVREIAYLHRLNEVVTERAEKAEVGQMVFQEADLSIRVVRDVLVEEFEGAIIDDAKQYDRVTKFLQRTAPELAERVELYKAKEPCSRSGTSRRRSTRCSPAGSTCPPAAT